MSMTTVLLVGIALTAVLYVFRSSLPRIVGIGVCVFALLWFYTTHNGDFAAMWATVWGWAGALAAWLSEFANSLNGSTEVITVSAPTSTPAAN